VALVVAAADVVVVAPKNVYLLRRIRAWKFKQKTTCENGSLSVANQRL
jgi:hypothetical protein